MSTTLTPSPSVRTPARTSARRRRARAVWWRHAVGLAALAFALLPLAVVVSASFNPRGSLSASAGLFSEVSTANYAALLTDPAQPYPRWFLNSLVISGITAAGTVLLGAAAAYALSRFRFRGRRATLLSLLLLQIFPQTLSYVAIYLLLTALGEVYPPLGLDSQLALIMVYLGGALGVNTYLMYGFFSTVPVSIDEAARIDGASHAQIFFGITLRLVAPVLAVVGLLSFVATTSEFLIASVVLQDPTKQTLAVGLYRFVAARFQENWGVFAAGALIAAVPVVLLFQFLQRFVVSGLTAGAVKG